MLITIEINVAKGFIESQLIHAFALNTFGFETCKDLIAFECSYANLRSLETIELEI